MRETFFSLYPGAFDAGFFSMTPSQVEQVDPQQQILLETVYESLENAGEKDIKGCCPAGKTLG